MNVKIDPTWQQVLQGEFDAPYFADLARFVHQEYRQGPCYPPAAAIFNAFNLCPFDRVKVVIIGQDPYHEPGQAEGLCFSRAEMKMQSSPMRAIHVRCRSASERLALVAGVRSSGSFSSQV